MDDTSPPEAFEKLERRLPENCVEYMLFVLDSNANLEGRKLLSSLESVRKAAVQLAEKLTKEYIWQRGGFDIKLRREDGLLFLHGTTDYSDSVEDEWLIVYILREVTKSFPNLWVRAFDSDGEFLLVEAAGVLPKWINPEIDAHRVWIHNGQLLLIPVDGDKGKPGLLTLPQAVDFLQSNPRALAHPSFVEEEAFYRLQKYPGHITASLHHSCITIPRKLAYILHAVPKSAAPAVEAFYLREPLAMKPLMTATSRTAPTTLAFPPTDLITVSIKLTKVLYAQLKFQPFSSIPPIWAQVLGPAERAATSKSATTEERKTFSRLETGMKISVGFELLSHNAATKDVRAAREVVIMLEDLAEDGDSVLPSNDDIKAWPHHDRDDDESWMDIDFNEFEKELEGRKRSAPSSSSRQKAADGVGFGDATTQADLRKMVERFEEFLNDDKAGVEGAEMGDSDDDDSDWDDDEDHSSDEDKEVSFDENEFARMMREMMGMPSGEMPASTTGGGNRKSDPRVIGDADMLDSTSENAKHEDEEEQIRSLTRQMETELNEHGALKLDATTEKPKALEGKSNEPIEKTTSPMGSKGKETARTGGIDAEEEDSDEESGDEEVDIDYNLAKNLLESFKSQGGLAGPAGNILGMMGMQLPRDEDEVEVGEEEVSGPSGAKGKGRKRQTQQWL
ncbi:hypothetical protein MKZ38_004496 [Zalerion maritima]|uniref:Ecdysoneless n=1 Tax=Zalerion maritima TaxID=339359 RepID=A0AAD5RLW7_9PEZI|nr:hypothetical protein MKZ38_004496 [Zalerion maritima]